MTSTCLVINRNFPHRIRILLWATICAFRVGATWFLGEAHGRLAGDEAAVGERSAMHTLGTVAFSWLGVKEILHLLFSLFTTTYWGNRGALASQVGGSLEAVRIVWRHVLCREVELAVLLARHLRLEIWIRPGACWVINVWHLGLSGLRKLPRLLKICDASSNTLTLKWSLTLTAILRMILLSALPQHWITMLELVCRVLFLRCSEQWFKHQWFLVRHRIFVEGRLWTALVELMRFLFSARRSCRVGHDQKRCRIIERALFLSTLLSLCHVEPYLSSTLALIFIRRLICTVVHRCYLVVHFLAAADRINQFYIVVWRWVQRHSLLVLMWHNTFRVFYADDVYRLAMFSNHILFFVFNIVFQSWCHLRFNVLQVKIIW